jgi:hypothetical protein
MIFSALMRNLGARGTLKENPEYFLGLNIHYEGLGKIRLSCVTYTETLKAKYPLERMTKSRRDVKIPCDDQLLKEYEIALLHKAESPVDPELLRSHGSKVGSLIYLVPTVRCDVAATIGILARCLTFPTVGMDVEADRCSRYLYDSIDLGITFDGTKGDQGRPDDRVL